MPEQFSPLRICLVGPAWPYRGGIAHFLESLETHLRRAGHEVFIVNFSRQYPGWLFPGESQYDSQYQPDDEPLHPQSDRIVDTLNPFTWNKAAQHILKERADVVLFSYWNPFFAPAFGRMARRLRTKGVQILALLHNALPHERKMGDRMLGRYFFQACHGFLVMSEQVKGDLTAMVNNVPVFKAAHPVYEMFGELPEKAFARCELGLKTEEPTLLFFGHVRPYKGLKVLLKAMPALVEKKHNVRLLIAGEFYEKIESYERMVDEFNLSANITIRPEYIPNDEVGLYFAASDLVVQPYHATTQSGVAQLAYHFCRPVVVTDVGELGALVRDGETGYVVPPNNPNALAEAIHRFFEEESEESFSQRIQEIKEEYSWERLVESVHQLVEATRLS